MADAKEHGVRLEHFEVLCDLEQTLGRHSAGILLLLFYKRYGADVEEPVFAS